MRVAIEETGEEPVAHFFVGVDSPCIQACSLAEVVGSRYASFKEVVDANIFSDRALSYLGGQVVRRKAVIHIMGSSNKEFKTIEIDKNGCGKLILSMVVNCLY